MLERRAPLDEVVAQESESAALREYGLILVDRAIFEAKYQLVRYATALCDLCHLTIGDGFAFKGAQDKKAMHQAFRVAHSDRICRQRVWLEESSPDQQDSEQAGSDMFHHSRIYKMKFRVVDGPHKSMDATHWRQGQKLRTKIEA